MRVLYLLILLLNYSKTADAQSITYLNIMDFFKTEKAESYRLGRFNEAIDRIRKVENRFHRTNQHKYQTIKITKNKLGYLDFKEVVNKYISFKEEQGIERYIEKLRTKDELRERWKRGKEIEQLWANALQENTLEAYLFFIDQTGKTNYQNKTTIKIIELIKDVGIIHEYIKIERQKKISRENKEETPYQDAFKMNIIWGYQLNKEAYSNRKYIKEVKEQLEKINFRKALKIGTIEALKDFEENLHNVNYKKDVVYKLYSMKAGILARNHCKGIVLWSCFSVVGIGFISLGIWGIKYTGEFDYETEIALGLGSILLIDGIQTFRTTTQEKKQGKYHSIKSNEMIFLNPFVNPLRNSRGSNLKLSI